MSQYRPLDPDLIATLDLHQQELPADDRERHANLDRPFLFGDCPVDNLQGILNIARNAGTILRAPAVPEGDWPIISIGAGPSLAKHLPALRALQDRAILISSVTALKGLQEAGICPHLTTPVERTEDMPQYLPDHAGNTRFAGAPLVCTAVARKFSHHHFVANMDRLYDWCALPSDHRIYFGSSTGTMSVSLAARMTSGPIYLVGHDLAWSDQGSHWSPATSIREQADGLTIEGNNGEMLPTHSLWKRFAFIIAEIARAHGNVVNVNASDLIGAKILNTKAGHLPDAAGLPTLSIDWGDPNESRLRHWKKYASRIARDARRACRVVENAKFQTVEAGSQKRFVSTDLSLIVPGPNGMVFSYLLVSIYASLSYMTRMRILTPEVAHAWAKSAIVNVLHGSRNLFSEIEEHAASA